MVTGLKFIEILRQHTLDILNKENASFSKTVEEALETSQKG